MADKMAGIGSDIGNGNTGAQNATNTDVIDNVAILPECIITLSQKKTQTLLNDQLVDLRKTVPL